MGIMVTDGLGKQIEFTNGEVILVKGSAFLVTCLCPRPLKIELSIANSDQAKAYFGVPETSENMHTPKLTEKPLEESPKVEPVISEPDDQVSVEQSPIIDQNEQQSEGNTNG